MTDGAKGESVQIRGVAHIQEDGLEEMYEKLGKKMNYSSSFTESLPALKHEDNPMVFVTVVPYEIRIRLYGFGSFAEKLITHDELLARTS